MGDQDIQTLRFLDFGCYAFHIIVAHESGDRLVCFLRPAHGPRGRLIPPCGNQRLIYRGEHPSQSYKAVRKFWILRVEHAG